MGGITLNKRSVYLRVSVIPLIVFALLGLLFNEVAPTETGTVYVTIVHTNDVHGRVWAEEVAMGYAHIAAKVKEIRETNKMFSYSMPGIPSRAVVQPSLSQGESIVKIMNSMDYDAMVAGNHDFAYGWQRLCGLSEMD
jgi:5'-nucleotidase/UDP-sugar diphosphatase